MMEYWHGRLKNENLKAAWKSAEALQEKAKNRLEDVQWPCSMCKKELDSTHYGVSPKFDKRFLHDYWRRIMAPGEWRMCMNCKAELRGGAEKYDTYECRACHRDLLEDHFSAERLEIWKKTSTTSKYYVCSAHRTGKPNGGKRRLTNISTLAAAVKRRFHGVPTVRAGSLRRRQLFA